MGLNYISIAAVIALLGAAPALHAETAVPAEKTAADAATAAPAPATAPANQPSTSTETAPAPAGTLAPAATPALNNSTQGASPAVPPAEAPAPAAPSDTKGDVLKLPKKAPASKKKKAVSAPIQIEVDGMPGRGASMNQVEQRFGQPREKLAPVGNPPISRWIYRDYTVYFEHEYVIHSVRNAGTAETTAPVVQPAVTAPAPQAAPTEAVPNTAAPVVQPATPAAPESATGQPPAVPEQPSTEQPTPAVQMPAPPASAEPPKPASGQ